MYVPHIFCVIQWHYIYAVPRQDLSAAPSIEVFGTNAIKTA
jgi:hypothetical protein